MRRTIIKYGLIVGVALMLTGITDAQAVYNFHITTIDGQQHVLSEYQGKAIAIVIIPSTQLQQDSLFLDSMNAIATRHADSITVIGVPSYETGYHDDSISTLTTYYDSLVGSSCVITQGLNTTKSSSYQDSLFTWLTNEAQNGHFNQDVEGIGQSFFIDSSGNLYGVFGIAQGFNDALIETMLQPADSGSQ